MKKAYYARPISVDGSRQAERDMDLIRSLGFEPYPIGEDQEFALNQYRSMGMEAFRSYVLDCQALVFRSFPDGSIGSGVAKEILWATEAGIPVIEIPRQITRRTLSVDETIDMLAELGQR